MEKYHQLKIAASILQTSIAGMAEEIGVTGVALTLVAQGRSTSERLSVFIDEKIAEADRIFQQSKTQRYGKTEKESAKN